MFVLLYIQKAVTKKKNIAVVSLQNYQHISFVFLIIVFLHSLKIRDLIPDIGLLLFSVSSEHVHTIDCQ